MVKIKFIFVLFSQTAISLYSLFLGHRIDMYMLCFSFPMLSQGQLFSADRFCVQGRHAEGKYFQRQQS